MRIERPEPPAPKRRLARVLRGRARTLRDGLSRLAEISVVERYS